MVRTQAALIASDPVYLTWLKESLQGLELHWLRPDDPSDPVLEQLSRLERLELVFIEAEPAHERAALLENLADQQPNLLLICVGADSPTTSVLDAMRAGARDFFVMGRDDAQMPERLQKLMRKSSQAQVNKERGGRLISLHSAAGGAGLAWTGEHLAHSLVELAMPGERVLLLDAATPSGAALVLLNLVQTYSLTDAIQDVYRCDQTLIETAFAKHPSGMYVLSFPEDLVEPQSFDEHDFLALLDVLLSHFRYIVLCCAANLSLEASASILNRAYRSLVVADGGILNSRLNKHWLKALQLEDCKFDRLGLLVESYADRRGVDAANLAQGMDLPLWADLPVSPLPRSEAMNTGELLSRHAPKDAYLKAVATLAEQLDQKETADMRMQSDKSGFLQRLLGGS